VQNLSPLPQAGEGQGVRGDGALASSHLSPSLPASPSDENELVDGKVLETIRMILSGVARTQSRFACGKNLIAQMLCGSTNSKVSKLRLDKLSTFGLLKHLAQTEVSTLIDALIAMRCIKQVDIERFRPVLELTDFGQQVMKGDTTLAGPLPAPTELIWKLEGRGKVEGGRRKAEEESASDNQEMSYPPLPSSPPDPELLEALKQWRADVADEAGVPRYCILSNDTIVELARCRPQNREQLLVVKGIGPVKAERYGTTLLEIIADEGDSGGNEVVGEPQITESEPSHVPSTILHPPSDPVPPSHYWTHRLLQAGFSVDECAMIRGLGREVILGHVQQAPLDERLPPNMDL
jgi:ATP-dependent DNA helicase RecQ